MSNITDTRFNKDKSITNQAFEFLSLVYDVISTIFIAIPLICKAFYKSIFTSRKDIRGKLALVTGGGNGLGRWLCIKLADQGCNIAVIDVNLKAAEQTADEIRSRGLLAKAYRTDVTKFDEITKLRDDIENDLGPVDILVNNAGLMSNTNMDEKPDYIELMLKVNVLGPMLMAKCFLESMKKHGSGHIVTVSSMSGLHPTPFSIPYTATKFGSNGFMAALTEHLRLEKLRSKIKTTCVFPYYIKTRAEVIDFLHPDIRFPPLEIDETAHEAVQGILRDDHVVTIPGHHKAFTKFVNVLPLCVQELIRDRIMREHSFADPNCKMNFTAGYD